MQKLSAITKQNHAHKSWTRYSSYMFASKENLAPLAGAEISKSVHAFPMAFIKQQDTFSLMALLSLKPGTNLFVAPDGRWLGGYIPSAFRGYPFQLAKVIERDDLVLCVDEYSGLINNDKAAGEPFFDVNGDVSQPVKDILNFLNQVVQNRAVTNVAAAALADAGVITEWPLKIKDQGREKPVTGLYRIDETKLNALDDDQFLKLRKAQALPIAYAQLLSMDNIQVFARLAKAQAQMNQMAQAKSVPQVSDIKPMLGDDDMISFQ